MDLDLLLGSLIFQEAVEGSAAEEWLRYATSVLARASEAVAAVVIAVGVLRALFAWLGQLLPLGRTSTPTESIRLGLGRSLGLSLEFLLAADILNTAVAPSWEAIGKLAAIATIRTFLNYFLSQELRQEERRRESESQSSPEPDGWRPGGHADGSRSRRSAPPAGPA